MQKERFIHLLYYKQTLHMMPRITTTEIVKNFSVFLIGFI